MATRGSQAGFTLLEVLAAFIIAALALGVLFNGGLAGMLAARTAGRYGEAISRAESHLAEASAGSDLGARDNQGDEGSGFHWRVRIQPVALAVSSDTSKPVPALYGVSVAVSWVEGGRTRSVTLQTERTGTAPVPAP